MRLAVFLAALIGFGILTVPRAIRAVQKLGQSETTLVASIGICFAAALLALVFFFVLGLTLGCFGRAHRRIARCRIRPTRSR